ncbi:unnamed protein product, partial [Didymodactylos carnosus]
GYIWSTATFLKQQLENLGIDYVFIGGIAVYMHGYQRTTHDVNLLMTREFPGDGREKLVSFPDPITCQEEKNGLKIITLAKLIELKLASYQSLPVNRFQDMSDVISLIKILNLNEHFAEKLHPSVRDTFHATIVPLKEEKKDVDLND